MNNSRYGHPDKDKSSSPAARFLGWQEDLPGRPLIAMYNIIGGKRHGSTVTARTLRLEGIEVPDPGNRDI